MAEFIRMPKMSDTMQHGIVSRWIKQVGDKVVAGDILAEIDTDKATMELEVFEDGTLLHIGIAEKSAAQVNDIIAVIGQPGEDVEALLAAATTTSSSAPPTTTDASEPMATNKAPAAGQLPVTNGSIEQPAAHKPPSLPAERVFASPLAKKVAKEKGYDIAHIQGSGQAGRVIKKDVIHFAFDSLGQDVVATQSTQPSYQDVPLSSMRATIAKVLTESKMNIPHFYLTVGINMDNVVALRGELNRHAATKISINDLIIKAAALSLTRHPKINVAWLGDKIRSYQDVHIGVAVAIEDSLVVPVVRFADRKPLVAISKEVKALYEQAQGKKLTTADYAGATFTISNLGMLGIESFTAIINPPAACILAVGAIQEIPIVQDNQIVPAHMLQVTLSCDHRVVDGSVGALFLSTLKKLLEEPLSLLL